MRLIDEQNAADYLREVGWIGADERVTVQPLTGGVSNQVLYIARGEGRDDFVLKQARPQLRTPQPWFSSVERIWREVEIMKICQDLVELDAGDYMVRTPRILHEDRENYTFAMTAAPREHRVWKRDLLAGVVEPQIAIQCGRLLGKIHATTWGDAEVKRRVGDRKLFDELRLDPYYRSLARAFSEEKPILDRLIESVWSHPRSLVHADFSPKNLLVYPGGLMMVDFETGHYGDPAFDLGFFLSHLMLKAVYRAPDHEPYLNLTRDFWRAYRAEMLSKVAADEYDALVARGIENFAGCAWARLDGTSRIDYLEEPQRRDVMRQFCRGLLCEAPRTWEEVVTGLVTNVISTI
jgi:5-methylthioribose kinase